MNTEKVIEELALLNRLIIARNQKLLKFEYKFNSRNEIECMEITDIKVNKCNIQTINVESIVLSLNADTIGDRLACEINITNKKLDRIHYYFTAKELMYFLISMLT